MVFSLKWASSDMRDPTGTESSPLTEDCNDIFHKTTKPGTFSTNPGTQPQEIGLSG